MTRLSTEAGAAGLRRDHRHHAGLPRALRLCASCDPANGPRPPRRGRADSTRRLHAIAWRVVLPWLFFVAGGLGRGAMAQEQPPAWVGQPTRTVDNGYIVYVTEGEAPSLEQATFKSEAAGALDVANECSFAPKGLRVEDHYTRPEAGGVTVFTKTGLAFNDCEIAQAANDPNAIRRLANPQVEAMVKSYMAMLQMPTAAPADPTALADSVPPARRAYGGQTTTPQDGLATGAASPSASAVEPGAPPDVAAAAPATGVPPPPMAAEPGALADDAPPAAPEAFGSAASYLWARQQIYQLKQAVVLAPPGAYAPGAPQTLQFERTVLPLVQRVQVYQVAHPTVRAWPLGWSSYWRHPREPFFARHPDPPRPHPQRLESRFVEPRPRHEHRGHGHHRR